MTALLAFAFAIPQASSRSADTDADFSSGSFDGKISRASVVAKKSQVVEIGRAYETALVAEAEIADVVPLSDHSIYVLGKKVGATRITVVGKDKRIIQLIEVDVTPDRPNLRAKLKENVPDSDIRVSSVNGGIVLSGTVFDAPTVEKAMAIARRYSPDAVTNALAVAGPQQVMLEVRFVEASRTASRELGISGRVRGPSAVADTNQQIFDPGSGAIQAAALLTGAEPFGTMLARVLEGGTNVDVMIRALEARDLARRLAEPNLVTTSGDTASFLAGGEFPFPVSASDNRISIEFKQFGVSLAFTPTVLSGGLINLKIAPEVSDIDETTTVEVNNVRIPGLIVRRANTTVELKDGQSLAIAGLLQHSLRSGQQQLPWIGQVPVLGALFRSTSYQKQESDLVIIVTPRLVKPARPGVPLATPLDKPMAGNDVDLFLNGRSEVTGEERRREPKQFGHIISTGSDKVTYVPSK
ncbi:MAG: type II and III secretion system protein family protein [Hyphomicrobium sp.]